LGWQCGKEGKFEGERGRWGEWEKTQDARRKTHDARKKQKIKLCGNLRISICETLREKITHDAYHPQKLDPCFVAMMEIYSGQYGSDPA